MRVWGSDLFIIERQNSRKSVKHARFCKKGASLRSGKLYYLTNTVITIPRGVYPLLIDTLSIYYTPCLLSLSPLSRHSPSISIYQSPLSMPCALYDIVLNTTLHHIIQHTISYSMPRAKGVAPAVARACARCIVYCLK